MKMLLFFFIGLLVVSVVLNVSHLHSQGTSTASSSPTNETTPPSQGTKEKAPAKSAPKAAPATTQSAKTSKAPQGQPASKSAKSAVDPSADLITSCQGPTESIYARGMAQDAKETVLGLTANELTCPDGNYQGCLYTCFSNLECNDICPCLNSCYDTCRQYITCGQWSQTDIVSQITGVASSTAAAQGLKTQ